MEGGGKIPTYRQTERQNVMGDQHQVSDAKPDERAGNHFKDVLVGFGAALDSRRESLLHQDSIPGPSSN
jgi:hypothetical protein